MAGTVTLPTWLVVLGGLLFAWAALDRLLIPGVRWFLRRRVDRVIDEINRHLDLEIPPFNLTKRQVLIDRLMYDPQVMEAAAEFAREQRVVRDVAMADVRRYAREIVPSFNAYAYFRLGYWLARRAARLLYRVRLGYTDDAGFRAIDPRSSVVFVMNHRSNMDYVLVAYLAATRTALSYAVGEWARIWPLQTLIRWLGAYFVRRNSGNRLYRRVLQRYVAMATDAGVVQAVFPEGGLTCDGALRAPKLGLLDYMLRSFDPQGERDLVFIPVGINYDRTFEDRTVLRGLEPAARRRGAVVAFGVALGFLLRNLVLMLRRRWFRFGYACVNFGSPLSMREYCAERGEDFRRLPREARFARVQSLAGDLMQRVGKVIPVLPVSLVCTVFLRRGEVGLSELELKAEAHGLLAELRGAGAHVYIPRGDQDYAIGVGLRMLVLRHLVSASDGVYRARPEEVPLLRYYANAIAHLLPGAAR